MQNVQPAFVNQFGQPCDSLGNPLVAAAPQQQVVYVQAQPQQQQVTYAAAPVQGQVVYAQPPAYNTLPPQYAAAGAAANTTVAVGAQQAVVYAAPPAMQAGGAAAAAGAGAKAAAAQVSAKGATSAAGFHANGKIVVLMSVASGKSLRVVDLQGHLEGRGAKGEFAQWKVHAVSGGAVPHVKLESVKFPGKYLRIDEKEQLNANGTGGALTEFAVIGHDNGTVSLQSVHHAKAGKELHVGVLANGDCKPPAQTGQGPNGRYTPHFIN